MRKILASGLAAFWSLAAIALAQPVILPSDGLGGDDPDGTPSPFGDAYGSAIERWKEWLFVGAPRETALRAGAPHQDGAVYVYRFGRALGKYLRSQKIARPGTSAAGSYGDRFGGAIAVNGGWALIGVSNDQDFPGLADPRPGIGAPGEPPFTFAGKVIVYRLDPASGVWTETQTLTAPEPGSYGQFGARTQATHIALGQKARVAVIGEQMNFEGGIGRFHTYYLAGRTWRYRQTIHAPTPRLGEFGEGIVFADERHIVVGGQDIEAGDGDDFQGHAFVYRRSASPGGFQPLPVQTIAGAVVAEADPENPICASQTNAYGEAGLAAAAGRVAIAEPCWTTAAGAFASRIDVYKVAAAAAAPLTLEQALAGFPANSFAGSNNFGSRTALSLSEDGNRLLIGSPRAPAGGLNHPGQAGTDVLLYRRDPALGWVHEASLAAPAAATGRQFGDAVLFLDGNRAVVREGNFLDPVVGGARKGRLLIYDLP